MSAAGATVPRGRGKKGMSPQQKRLILFGGATVLIVLFYVFAKRSSSTATTNTTSATQPYQDPTTGQWIDPTTGLPIGPTSTVSSLGSDSTGGSGGVLPGANADPLASSDPFLGMGFPTQVQLVDAAGNPVTIPTASGNNGNAGTGSSSAPSPATEPALGGEGGINPVTGGRNIGATRTPAAPAAKPVSSAPPAYRGGAEVVKVAHLKNGATLTTLATGAIIEQLPGHSAYTVHKATGSSTAPAPHQQTPQPVSEPKSPAPSPPSAPATHVPAAPPSPHIVLGNSRAKLA